MPARRVNQLLQARPHTPDEPTRAARVLVVEEEPFAGDAIAAELRDRKHIPVTWCRGSDGLVDCTEKVRGGCPLHGPVDLVLDVRTGSGDRLTGGELGVACAALEGIPVVAAGPVRPGPEEAPWALARCTLDEAAELFSHVLEHTDAWQNLRLEDLVRRVASMGEEEVGELSVDVVRWPDAVTVVVATSTPLSPATCAEVDRALRSLTPRIAPAGAELFLSFTGLPLK